MGNTYKYLEKMMSDYFADKLRAQHFKMEFEDQMEEELTKVKEFPFVFAAIVDCEELEGVTEFNIDLYCWDLVQEGRENVIDVISDTHQILRDFYKWLEDDGDEFIIVTSNGRTRALNNGLLDEGAGNVMEGLTLEVPSTDPCLIPTTPEEEGGLDVL